MAQESSLCPRYHRAVELLGRRWAGAIIRLLLNGPARYNELRAGIPDISDRMLAERLKELESEGVVVRTVLPEAPIGVEYGLTEKGKALEGPVLAIGKWAEKWLSVAASSKGSPAAAARGGSRRR
jgi:DNA-binding HxlR family transcriptional regulator